ncbi:MAG TPA: hypothetical protein DCE44_12590 [Verrucomicrobiales bacterium]|nr:hypothetical protein [Verrucomicrobiales bacterium]
MAFRSTSTSFRGPSTSGNLFLRDLQGRRTFLLNDPSFGQQLGAVLGPYALSADGTTVLLSIFNTGIIAYHHPEPKLIRLTSAWTLPVVSSDGRWAVYGGPTVGTPAELGLFIQSTQGGEARRLLSPPNHEIAELQISADASVVTYSRRLPGTTAAERIWQVYALSVGTGVEELISAAPSGAPGNERSRTSQISADGRFVVYPSYADNLVANDANGTEDIFVRDRYTGTTTLLSRTSDGHPGNSLSTRPQISGDGRFVAFTTFADDLVAGDHNAASDVVMVEIPRTTPLDTDADGLPDQWELDHLGNLTAGATTDSDGDGMSNGDEWAARTAPEEADSRLSFSEARAEGSEVSLEWLAHAGVKYRVELRGTLDAEAPWSPSGEDLTGYEGRLRHLAPLAADQTYYRVTVVAD